MISTVSQKPDFHSAPGILFVIGGLGLGNSTRCSAIIEHLRSQGWEVDVATAARGFSFFSKSRQARGLYELKQAFYVGSRGSIGALSVFFSALSFPVIGLWNCWRLFRLIRRLKPALILTDSNYNWALWAFKTCPLISLNNSLKIFHRAREEKSIFPGCAAQFLVECADAFFQKIFPDYVIVPWPETVRPVDGNVIGVEPIAREQFGLAREPRAGIQKTVVMYSGSGLDRQHHEELIGQGLDVTVVGKPGSDPKLPQPTQLTFTGDTLDCSEFLKESDLVISSGGFSSISEALAAKKPLIIVPIRGHAEQNINALWVERLGVGIRSESLKIKDAVLFMSENYQRFLAAYDRLGFSCNGARQAALKINDLARRAGR